MMKKSLKLVTLFAIILAASCSQERMDQKAEETDERIEPVRTMTLDYQTVARSVEYTATLLAFEEIHMAPAAPGRIEKIYPEVGDRVKKGEMLVQMDRTQLHQAEIQLKTLEADFRRFDTLKKAGSIPQQQYDQLKSQIDVLKANVEFLRENTRLHAPFNGVISGRYYESGEVYSGAPSPLTAKAAVVSIVQIDRLKAVVPVSERFFPLIKIGMEADLNIDTYPGKTFKGHVFRIHPTIDPASRTFSVEVAINNQDNKLRPGMFSRVNFDLEEIEALLLPAIAVLKLQGSNERYIFIEENNRARRIGVIMGTRYNDDVEVISDELKPGQKVIVSGQARLLDGMAVEVVE
ncbi:MAG TPA: efflux RND transporter periplasmic adaptor subunit [Bacteroidales bacterium]|nr:efflux RND transporter periplasmic adaptor subunit [Bacteroidales bacterium]